MFDDNFIGELQRQGLSVADAVRSLQPGSRMDRLSYSTQCPRCGRTVRESIRWFHEREFACSCGAQFDDADIQRFIALLRRGDLAAARAIRTIQPIVQQTEEDV